MAAPLSVTTKAMGGKFLMNKTLSSSTEEMLKLQGVSWIARRAVSMFSLTLFVEHTTDEAGVEHLKIGQKLSGGGIPAPTQKRILDWQEYDEYDDIFGHAAERSHRIPLEEVKDEYLKEGWDQDTIDNGIVFLETWSAPDKNKHIWKVVQTWGFAMVDGERRYVRRATFTSDQKEDPIHGRFVYNYLGPV